MLIKRRPIITWLLHPDSLKYPNNILLSGVANPINSQILNDQLAELDNIRIQKPYGDCRNYLCLLLRKS